MHARDLGKAAGLAHLRYDRAMCEIAQISEAGA
jgi:hypothetical protein